MRIFIGFFVPENIKKYVVGLQLGLEKLPMNCKMVERDNLHVCLSFLGNVSNAEVERIQHNLSKLCKGVPAFEVTVSDVKVIPNEKYIRVIVLEVSDSSGMLKAICSGIKEKIGGSMKPPHLTLCRVKNVSNKEEVVDSIKKIEIGNDLKFVVDSIDLIKSELGRTGPTYTVVHDAKLVERL